MIDGYLIILLIDCVVNFNYVVILVMLVVGVVYYYLICKGLCLKCGIVVEIGDVCEMYYFVILFGYGVNVVNLYLVVEIIVDFKC